MTSDFAVLASLALAIFFSPETLVLGLIIAGDKKAPRLAAVGFGAGAVLGIAFATGIGLWVATAAGAGSGEPRHHGWPGFVVRVVIAVTLLIIGFYRAWNAMRHRPIADISESDHTPGRLTSALKKRFPAVMRQLDLDADLPLPRRVARAALAGFAICGLHPKVFPIAIAAGHQIVQLNRPAERGAGVVLFAVIAVLPALVPTVIELINPGATGRIKEGYERIMRVHGRWITAALLLAAGTLMSVEAWRVLPRG
ncbi:GAP family protein [Mycolicibacterium sp.]|uniref:GAP family protein n=1 Tax=Mycolicibacterium sp. TaxID=2320850 RepID=UPI001D3D76F0|nr:GAP family protein [Mycolicibacterium sp.]MCB1291900.1 GAP family protein [Mycobacterium sp.]MCB9410602.1 GAP family protein [Mycolicibacterium sp.]